MYEPRQYWSERYRRDGELASTRVGYTAAKAERQARRFARELPPVSGRVLDWGCGAGRFVEKLNPAKPNRYLGVDISPAALAIASERYPSREFRLWSPSEPLNGVGTFDYVAAITVLQHTPDEWLAAVFEQWRQVCRPGTVVAIIDSAEPSEAPHMHTRSAAALAVGLGLEVDTTALVDADFPNSHYALTGRLRYGR